MSNWEETGNRLVSSYSYDSNNTSNRYDVTTYTYDIKGNSIKTTVDGVTAEKSYTLRNELNCYVKGTTKATYATDADGLRTRKTVNGVRTNYIWSGGNIVAEITGDKIVTYLYGLNRISRKITGPKYVGTHVERDGETGEIISETPIEFYRELYIYDGHGSVVQTVSENIDKYIGDTQYHKGSGGAAEEFDADGDNVVDVSDIILFLSTYPVVRSYHYDAFGNQLSELADYDTNPFRYSGEYWDKESNEIYLRARHYNSKTGRFGTVDPAMDGTNWYVYCKGNPIAFVDPWGLRLEGLREMTDNIGAELKWNNDTKTATVKFNNTEVVDQCQ